MNRHQKHYCALAAVYALTAAILLAEAAYLHSLCALLAGLIYLLLALPGKDREKGAE